MTTPAEFQAVQAVTTAPPTGVLTPPILSNTTTPTPTTTPSKISATAQDISKAQGVAYEQVATGALGSKGTWADYDSSKVASDVGTLAAPKTSQSYIDTAKNTVAGQLSSLLSSDSPYIKQAQTKAQEQAASRGLLNTTLAAQAGQKAAIESALPIAQQDAETYNKFGLQQQQAENAQQQTQTEAIVSSYLNKQTADIKQTAQNIQNAFTAKMAGADAQTKTFLQDFQQKHALALQDMIGDQNAFLQSTQIAAEKAQQVYTQAGQYVQNYQIAIENMMTDPDFLAQGTQNVNNAIRQLQTLTKNQIKFIGAAAGLDMTKFSNLVNNYFPALSFTTTPPPAATT